MKKISNMSAIAWNFPEKVTFYARSYSKCLKLAIYFSRKYIHSKYHLSHNLILFYLILSLINWNQHNQLFVYSCLFSLMRINQWWLYNELLWIKQNQVEWMKNDHIEWLYVVTIWWPFIVQFSLIKCKWKKNKWNLN